MGSLSGRMLVSIEFFGKQRVVTKTDGINMPITGKTRVNDALEYVRQRYPALSLDEGTIFIAVNREVASLDTILRANDTIAFLPFIGGG